MFKDKPLEIRKTLVKQMVARMASAYGVKKSALPTLLNCQKSVVNNWGYYGRIPYDQLDACHQKTGVSMDWLLYGKKPTFELTEDKLKALQQLTTKLLVDGCDFKLITECYEGAGNQLTQKLQKDLLKWLECEPDSEQQAQRLR